MAGGFWGGIGRRKRQRHKSGLYRRGRGNRRGGFVMKYRKKPVVIDSREVRP